MGSTSSKFRKALQNGEEYVAMQLYMNSPELRKSLDPNLSYGDNYNHDTPLHYVSKHAMKSLLRLFLKDLNGNPNKKNSRNETSIHNICMCSNGLDPAVQAKRAECLYMILQWEGAILRNGEREKADIDAIDEKGNTALHYAADSGLKKSVELLVTHESKLFVENKDRLTPCDVAEKSNNLSIALYLESKMVFSTEAADNIIEQELSFIEPEEPYTGLRPQDLQEAKDQLLVETSDMLRVPLFTAEALLRNHEWSRENLLESWMKDPVACCDAAGAKPPSDIAVDNSVMGHRIHASDNGYTTHEDIICDICAGNISRSEDPVDMPCNHQFCRICWESYLTGKIQEGDAHNILCPAYNCTKLVPLETIENLVSRDMARRYLQFDIKAFVDSNPHIKWCPAPGCGRAVKYPEGEATARGSASNYSAPPPTSKSVDCGTGHFFCWDCLGEAHEPCSCENLKIWHEKITEIKPEELSNTTKDSESAANFLWLVTNSKPCPKCNSPIQKNEGCNHMKCTKCKYDFCWVCLEPWNKHGSATGGYFRCNRYEAVQKADEKSGVVIQEAEEKNRRMQELNKFVHYYTRYKNHENSFKLEQPLIRSAKEKMMVLAKAVTDSANASSETQFIVEAINELLKARRVLKFSYAYGYYLEDDNRTKTIFEFMQTELEEATETLSQMVARPYLRTPRYKIIQAAQLVQRKRHEFLSAVSKGLIPPEETPPLLRRKQFARKNIFNFEHDDDGDALRQAIAASLQEMPPGGDGWMMDKSGRHNNIPLLYEYLGFDSEESDDASPTAAQDSTICLHPGCEKPRARNKRTGALHEYCGLKCMRQDKLSRMESDSPPFCEEENTINNDQIDLLRALEMSRLLLMEQTEQLDRRTEDGEASSSDRNTLQLPALMEKLTSPRQKRRISSQRREESAEAVSAEVKQSTQPSSEDLELQRALEMSCQSLREVAGTSLASRPETDLERALKLSLQEVQSSTSEKKDAATGGSATADEETSEIDLEELLKISGCFKITQDTSESQCNQTEVQYPLQGQPSVDPIPQDQQTNSMQANVENLHLDDLEIPSFQIHAPATVNETECSSGELADVPTGSHAGDQASDAACSSAFADPELTVRVRDHSPLRRTCSGPGSPARDASPIPDLLRPPSPHTKVARSLSAPQEGASARSETSSPGTLRNRRAGSSPTERCFLDPRDSPHMWDSAFLDYRVCRSPKGSPSCQRNQAIMESTSKEVWQKNIDDIWQKMPTSLENTKSQSTLSDSPSQSLERAFEMVHFPSKQSKPKESLPVSQQESEKNSSSKLRKNRHSIYSSSPSRSSSLDVKEKRRTRSVSPSPRHSKQATSREASVGTDAAAAVVDTASSASVTVDHSSVKGAAGVTKEKTDKDKKRKKEKRSRRKEKEAEVGWQLYV
ncbi:ankyrin repeat and IBR domain-containing protein 1-like isoform X2 [Ptychodera flava]|uniref:ankyrin repeat and IBR domain-containing protein 1-like isoform X2 n=1 Tax=Ptychodera flava TaxID=63121 RepID=UPI003969EF16